MKVLMLGRIGLMENGGGDKIQIENTANELRNLGVEVDISTGFNFDPLECDLIHIFQLDWTAETNLYAQKVKKAGKPLVLSPIHHNLDEVKKFDDLYAFDFRRLSRFLFKEQHDRDTFKNVYRSLSDSRKIVPTIRSVFKGLKKMHQETLKLADIVLVQTDLEAKDLQETYGLNFNWAVVPNGVGELFLNAQQSLEGLKCPIDVKDYILCVGRIEPRKNQLKIMEAVCSLRDELQEEIPLVFIGKTVESRHFEYTHLFKKALKKYDWVTHIQQVPYAEIPAYYQCARVGISASWFETTGLTSLEALFCGTNAVASGERAKAYLQDLAYYCIPEDTDSIKEALKKAYFASPPEIPDHMRTEYTWKNAAQKTAEIYQRFVK